MTPLDLVIHGGQVVLGDAVVETDVGVQGGRIAALGNGLRGERSLDARGALVLPGLVDPHVHPIHAEDLRSASHAAVHGGVTTTLHHLYTPPDGDPLPTVDAAVREVERVSYTDVAFHVRLNDLHRTHGAIADLVARGITSIKLFMAYGGRGIMVSDDELLLAMRAAAECGATLLVHAENGHMSDALEAKARAAGATTLAEYYAARPRWVEVEAVERVLRLLRAEPCPTYLVHLTCCESLAAVSAAKLDGLLVIAETCPHYLLLTADTAAPLGARAKMAPPLRDQADQDALWRALDRGLIDTVGSDHSAFVREEKEASSDVFDAGFGVPGIATMLPLLFDRGVRAGRTSLPRLVQVLASAPARWLGLGDRKGALHPGFDADVVIFDPDAPFEIDAGSEHGNAYYSLYEGWRGHGRVRDVLLRGQPVIEGGTLVAEPGIGRHLPRRPRAAHGAAPASTWDPAPDPAVDPAP